MLWDETFCQWTLGQPFNQHRNVADLHWEGLFQGQHQLILFSLILVPWTSGEKKLAEREAVLVWALTWSQPREGNGALQSPTQEQGRAPGQWQNTLQCLVFYTKSSCKHIWVSPALQDFKSSFPSLPKLLLSKEWTRHWSCFSQRLLGIKLLGLQVGSTWGHRREACLLLCTWACARCLLSPQRMMLLELPQLYLSSPWGMEIGRWIETTRQKENLSGKQWIFQDAQGKFFGL